MEYFYRDADWNNIHVLGRNRLPVRPFYCGYRDACEALKGIREESGNFRLLNGEWKFTYYESPFLVPDACVETDYPDEDWTTMPVPGHWQLNGFDYPHYNDAIALFPTLDQPQIQADNPTGVYRLEFREKKEADREYILRFDGVESAYHVWLNGAFIGYSQGSRNTAEFDITDALKDGDNVLAVKVYKFCDGSYLENQDMWWFAGIIRDVSLISRPQIHLQDWTVNAKPHETLTDGTLHLEIKMENHTEKEELVTVKTVLYDGGVPVINMCEEKTLKVGITSWETDCVVENIQLWSAEMPVLYTLAMTIEKDGKVVESYSVKTGFRKICLKDGLFWVNGKAIKLKGVNRHDWNEFKGRCVSKEDMIADLYLMKRNNINAVRTSHYPPHPDFLDLCDSLGFYVMEEADLECNQMAYTKSMNRISDDTLWEESYVDRAARMACRDKNHPSVLFWSLGNESGFGSSFVAAGRFLKEYDPTRLIHYEEDRDASIADVYSTMYTRHKALEDLGRDSTKSKPHVVCEYAHAMGNGPGGLKEYWEIFEKYPRLQGGFIWEWIDMGIKKYDEAGQGYYTYGGDYGDYPNSGAFCCDGLIQADRRPTPSMLQVKKVMEPVVFSGFDKATGEITVKNRYDFADLKHLRCTVRIYTLEGIAWETEADISEIKPWEEKRITLFHREAIKDLIPEEEVWMNLSVTYRERPVWAKEDDYEVAFHQEMLQEAADKENDTLETDGEVHLKESGGILIIEGPDFKAEFDRVRGYLCGYTYKGQQLMKKGLGMNFWRAPVDNDKNVQKTWEEGMLKSMTNVVEKVTAKETKHGVEIHVSQIYAPIVLNWKILVKAVYEITADGVITLHYEGIPTGVQLPESFPRIGMRFVLDKACESAAWYGRGPAENYKDSKEGNPVGYYESTADDFYFPYVVPQETGNHEDTRWAAFFTPSGRGICITGDEMFSFGALHYSQEELTRASHTNELHRTEDIFLSVDYAQHGLGSASWGAECLEKDKLYPEPFSFTWKIFGTEKTDLKKRAENYRKK